MSHPNPETHPELPILMDPVENAHEDGKVYCARVRDMRSVDEHLHCPYCFAPPTLIETADHTKFCDFEPGKDPVNFGFPEWSHRNK